MNKDPDPGGKLNADPSGSTALTRRQDKLAGSVSPMSSFLLLICILFPWAGLPCALFIFIQSVAGLINYMKMYGNLFKKMYFCYHKKEVKCLSRLSLSSVDRLFSNTVRIFEAALWVRIHHSIRRYSATYCGSESVFRVRIRIHTI